MKSQAGSRLDPSITIFNQVAKDLASIWESAFVVPIITEKALAQKLKRDCEKKITMVRSSLKYITDSEHPDRLTSELSRMKKLYNISKCVCFVDTQHRQDKEVEGRDDIADNLLDTTFGHEERGIE